MSKVQYSREKIGEIVVDTWRVERESEKVGVSPIALITGLGIKPVSFGDVKRSIDEMDRAKWVNTHIFREGLRTSNYLGAFPYDLAARTGEPVHVLWQEPETAGRMFPRYDHESIEYMVEALDILAGKSKKRISLGSHSYGAFPHAKILARKEMGNFLPGAMIAPMTNVYDVVSSLGMFSETVMAFYRMISHVSVPLFNLTSLDHFHGSEYDNAQSRHQVQNHFINSASAKSLLELNLEGIKINPANTPDVVITTHDRLMPYRAQKRFANSLGIGAYEIAAGHRIFTDREAEAHLVDLELQINREQLERYSQR